MPNSSFEAPASIVRVNVLWFLSLILSLSCALLATLMQQWARRYLGYAQAHGAPLDRVRLRAYVHHGAEKFGLSKAVEAMPLLLHSSVFLFFTGLIEFLFTINKTVAFFALGCVAVFAFIYAILTLAPNWRLNCPYRTPLSGIPFRLFQLSASSLFLVAATMEGIFHGLLLEIWQRFHPDVRGSPNNGPTKWREVLREKVKRHYKRSRYGLPWSIKHGAMDAPLMIDASALHETLTALDGEKELEDFAANMPGFFDSLDTPNATSIMLSLLAENSESDPILGSRLHELLNTCRHGKSSLIEEQRKSRLRVCLTSLWYCARAYNLPENSRVPLPPYVRAIFASPEVIGRIQTEEDPAIRLLGRCFWSLIVKKLSIDITDVADTTEIVDCLSCILGASRDQVRDWLDRKGAINLANMNYLASGEFETLVASGIERDVEEQTLSILAGGILTNTEWNRLPLDQVARFHTNFPRSAITNEQVPLVFKEQLPLISDKLPRRMEDSSPELDSKTTPFPGPS